MRARLWGRAMAEKLPEVRAEGDREPRSDADRPVLPATFEQRLRGAVTALASRLESLGSEPPTSEGGETVAVRVVGREKGEKEALPLPGIRVRFGWKSHQVEVLTDVSGWAVARLPPGLERGAYRVSVLNADGKVVASKKGTMAPAEAPPVHHFELRARPELRESFDRSRQWRESVSRAARRVSEFL